MFQMPEAILIRRVMDPAVQTFLAEEVLQHIESNNPAGMPVKKLSAGQANVTLLPEYEYGKALYHPAGGLRLLTTGDSKELLEENVRQSPTGSEWLTAETVETNFRSNRSATVIFYVLKQPKLPPEAKRFAGAVSRMNGRPLDTDKIFPNALVLLSLPRGDSRKTKLIKAFEDVRPKTISLMAAKVLTGPELREQTRQAEADLMDRLRDQADDRRRQYDRGGK
jgi:hypothetical protein